MKKRTSLVILSLPLLLLHTGESNAVQREPSIQAERLAQLDLTLAEIAWLQKHEILRIAGPKAFSPFQFVTEDGTIGGMASESSRPCTGI
jgi:hypothetical protein